jgi:hypothetical protein
VVDGLHIPIGNARMKLHALLEVGCGGGSRGRDAGGDLTNV